MIPLYENEDSVCGIVYNDTPYYFQKNLQGDIIAIVNASGTIVGKYSFDAWGKCTITYQNSRLGVTYANPFRYRGYYFDQETGFYYLQSRYYDPSTGRFINADEAAMSIMSSLNIANMCAWAYCVNNPVNGIDVYGYASTSLSDYAKECWIAWIMNKFTSKINSKKLNLIKFDKLGLAIQLVLAYEFVSGSSVQVTKDKIQASFKNVSFSLGWKGKLEASVGVSIKRYTIGFLRGIDWKRSYLALMIAYKTKDEKCEFAASLYISMAHLLKLAIAITVAGMCVVLPALSPVFMSAISIVSAKASAIIGLIGAVINQFARVPTYA